MPQNNRLTLDMRARCLMVILIGNLDLALEEDIEQRKVSAVINGGPPAIPMERLPTREDRGDDTTIASYPEIEVEEPTQPNDDDNDDYPTLNERGNELPRRPSAPHPRTPSPLLGQNNRRTTVQQASSPWRHMENLLYEIRLYNDENRTRGEFPRQWPKHNCDYDSW